MKILKTKMELMHLLWSLTKKAMVETHLDPLKKDAVAPMKACPNRRHLSALAQHKPILKFNSKNAKMAVKKILNNKENKKNASLRTRRRSLILCKVLRTSSITSEKLCRKIVSFWDLALKQLFLATLSYFYAFTIYAAYQLWLSNTHSFSHSHIRLSLRSVRFMRFISMRKVIKLMREHQRKFQWSHHRVHWARPQTLPVGFQGNRYWISRTLSATCLPIEVKDTCLLCMYKHKLVDTEIRHLTIRHSRITKILPQWQWVDSNAASTVSINL